MFKAADKPDIPLNPLTRGVFVKQIYFVEGVRFPFHT
jgi:hypothetical protein